MFASVPKNGGIEGGVGTILSSAKGRMVYCANLLLLQLRGMWAQVLLEGANP